MRTIKIAPYLSLLALVGCAPANVSPGMTFLVGLNGYQAEMERLEGRPERWFDRQRAGDALKKTYLLTMGGSREFNRMVDLDVKRREFMITLRDSTVKPDRVTEMKEELVGMNSHVDDLKEAVRAQVAVTELRADQQPQQLETIATVGLLNIAIDSFSSFTTTPVANPRATKVGRYVVSDFGGSLATVRTPEGQTYRCATLAIPETGGSIKCEPPSGK
jgi:hypothetical protein